MSKSEEFTMGSFLSKNNTVKIKNLLPKDSEIFQMSVWWKYFQKNTDFDILCFDVNFDGYFPTRVCLCPQNHPTAPPTPVVSDDNTVDSRYDCHFMIDILFPGKIL